nr:hypothetical protein [uncultured Roseateles sp.]
METVLELYDSVRAKFPGIRESADRVHARQWGEEDSEFAYIWFESLASAINLEMSREVDFAVREPLFLYISGAFPQASDPVRQCIDVAFVENLFWQVPSAKCAPYWEQLPPLLRRLYLDFHRREP